jgi:hypothetical protein
MGRAPAKPIIFMATERGVSPVSGTAANSTLAERPPHPDPPSLRFGGRVSKPAIALATAGNLLPL